MCQLTIVKKNQRKIHCNTSDSNIFSFQLYQRHFCVEKLGQTLILGVSKQKIVSFLQQWFLKVLEGTEK